MGRPAAGQPQVPGRQGSDRLSRLDPQGRGREHALRQVRLQPSSPAAARTSTTRRQLLQDPPRAGRGDGEHHAAVPGRALQLQQVPRPSVRALDAGPVLPAGRVLRAGQPDRGSALQGPAHRRHRRRGSASRWSRSSTTARAARSSTSAPAPCAKPAFPYLHDDLAPTTASRREQLAHWITSQGKRLLRQELRQSPLELSARRRHHRADRRHPRRQSADQSEAARSPDRGVHQQRLQRAARS